MNEIIQKILDKVDKKNIQSVGKKLLKKCSFKSQKDMDLLAEFALWLYVYGYMDDVVEVCDIVKGVEFDGNYTLWGNFDTLHCLKARVLRERGDIREAKKMITFVNQYRSPHLYKNGVEYFMVTVDKNIESHLARNSKAGARGWRLLKLELAITYKEGGHYPVSDVELEKIIREMITILSQEK